MTETASPRYDLDVLEFDAVRELLRERLATGLGRRLVDELAPLPSAAAANMRAREAVELAARTAGGDRLPIGGAVEVRSWIDAFFAGEHQPSTRDVADLKRLMRASERCRIWLAADGSRAALVALAVAFPVVADAVAELETIIDDRGNVLDSASTRLAELRGQIAAAELEVSAAVARVAAEDSVRRCLQAIEPTWRNGRPVLAVRQDMRGGVVGVLHDRSQSGATLFIEPASVVAIANGLADLRGAENREVQVVLTHVCRGLRRDREQLTAVAEAMSRLDVLAACATLIERDAWVAANVVDTREPLRLHEALHPLLLRATTDRPDLVPLEIALGESFRILVVTGPNTGGKTVALKTIGLLSVMALCGIPVPAHAGTQVPYFDGVFADIGDAQGISQSLSTLSSHVTRIVRCLRVTTERSLVLLDELGAGTDPEEGGALGYAVLEELLRRGVLAVVTTHVGRLKEFALQQRGAENGAMAFDGASLRPLYRLDIGIPGTSHALDIARRVGVSEPLIARARELMGVVDTRLEEQIQRVQEARRDAELERQRRRDLSLQVEADGDRLRGARQEVEFQRAWLHEEADALVEEQLRAVRERLDVGLRELGNGPRGFAEKAKELGRDVALLMRTTSLHRRRMQFVGTVRKDDSVYVPRLRKRCAVKRVDREKEILVVEVGKVRFEIPFEDVSWIQPVDGG